MATNQWIISVALVSAVALGGVVGCGGSRNSSDPDDAPNFALGSGEVNAEWLSSSVELVHNRSRGALYYLDVDDQDVVAIDVGTGDDSTLVSLLFGPSKLRLTADSAELYVLESGESANATNGLADILRFNVGNSTFSAIEFDANSAEDLVVDDFVATNNDRIVLASHVATSSSTPSEQRLSLINAFNGFEIDSLEFPGVVQALTLGSDQTTVLDQVMLTSLFALNTLSIAGDNLDLRSTLSLTLGQGATSTYEPEGDRVFRNNGVVWDDGQEKTLGTSYESIDFDLEEHRIVILVRGSSGFIIRYFDIDSLELLSEQPLPTITDAAGMEPVKLFVDDGELYVVYREITSVVAKDYLLVEFDYPS